MKIHITLVGGQLLPIYLGIAYTAPDKVIFVHSQETKENVARLQREISCKYETSLFSPVDYSSILYDASILQDKYCISGNTVTVNISGGTKLWSIVFYRLFIRQNDILYVDQNSNILNLSSGKKQPIDIRLDCDMVFRLNNTPVREYRRYEDYTDEDKLNVEKIKELRKFASQSFNKLATTFGPSRQYDLDTNDTGKWIDDNGSSITWNKHKDTIGIELFKTNGQSISRILSSPHVFTLLFHTGWFEFEVAQMLAGWKYAREIRMNVVFPYKDGKAKNEIDIIVNIGFKLLFVECKTRIFNQTDIDKFNTAVKNYGGMSCKSLFVSESVINAQVKEKCNDSNMIFFSLNQYREYPTSAICRKLYDILEKELLNINVK